jgi:hypothetical protein
MRNLFQAGLTFLTFAGLTLAMGMPSQTTRALETNLHAINVSPDAIPSAILWHSAEVAIDLPMPQGTHGDGKIAELAIDLPMPQGTRDNGEKANIDLPMPQGTHGDGQIS